MTVAADAAAHVHRWTGVDFYLDAGHPMVRQTCACGASRSFRAFERFWDPQLDRARQPAERRARAPRDAADGT